VNGCRRGGAGGRGVVFGYGAEQGPAELLDFLVPSKIAFGDGLNFRPGLQGGGSGVVLEFLRVEGHPIDVQIVPDGVEAEREIAGDLGAAIGTEEAGIAHGGPGRLWIEELAEVFIFMLEFHFFEGGPPMVFPALEPRELMVEPELDAMEGGQLPADLGGRGGRGKQVEPIGAVIIGQAAPEFFEQDLLASLGDERFWGGGGWGWGGWNWHRSSGV